MKSWFILPWIARWWRRWRGDDAGARGEALAARHLQCVCGFTIVARNWRNPRDRRDELDLVARDKDVLVFVEVKTRTADALVPGYYAVNPRKKRVVERAARAYVSRLKRKPHTVRFDVVEVELSSAGERTAPVVRHFENVPLFPKDYRPDAG